jgi:hypothetical protein
MSWSFKNFRLFEEFVEYHNNITITVTHIYELYTVKSCIKVLQKASQNTRHKIVTT